MNLRCLVCIFLSLSTLLFANSSFSYERTYKVGQQTMGFRMTLDSCLSVNNPPYEIVSICGGTPNETQFTNPVYCKKILSFPNAYYRYRSYYSITVDCEDDTYDDVLDAVQGAQDAAQGENACPPEFGNYDGSCRDADNCAIGTGIDLLTNQCVPDDCQSGSFAGAGNVCEVCPVGTDCYQEPPDPCLTNNTAPGCPGYIPDPDPDPDPNDPFEPDPDFPDGGSGSGSTDSPGVTVTPGGNSNPDDSGEPNEPNDSGIFDDRPDPSTGDDFSIPSPPPATGLPTDSNGDTSLDGLVQWLSEFTAPDDAIGTEASTQTSDLRGEVAERSVNVDLSQMAQIDSSGFLAESCPADVQVSTSFGNITISMSPICDLASLLKPLLIALVTYLVYMRVFYALVEIAD